MRISDWSSDVCSSDLVVVLACPDVSALPLECGSDHVVDEAVLLGQTCSIELSLELGLVDVLEDVLEGTVVRLENGVLGGQVHRVVLLQSVGERRASEVTDGRGEVVLPLDDAALFGEVDQFVLVRCAAVRSEEHTSELQ